MANLGNISKTPLIKVQPVAFYAETAELRALQIANYGRIQGVCTYGVNPVQYSFVYLLYEPILKIIGFQRTGADGTFTFNNLYIGGSTKTYTVVAKNPGQNDRVFSGIQAYNPYI